MPEPRWRQAYDAVEQRLTPHITAIVHSDAFATALGGINQWRRSIDAEVARASRRTLHMLNLPAGADVTRLLHELGQLRQQVNDLQISQQTSRSDGS